MNSVEKVGFLTIIGLFSGILAGGLGISAAPGILMGLMITGIARDYNHAVATTLLAILPPVSLGALYVYYKKHLVDIPSGIYLIILGFIANYFGAQLHERISQKKSELMIACFMLLFSLFMFWRYFFLHDKASK